MFKRRSNAGLKYRTALLIYERPSILFKTLVAHDSQRNREYVAREIVSMRKIKQRFQLYRKTYYDLLTSYDHSVVACITYSH